MKPSIIAFSSLLILATRSLAQLPTQADTLFPYDRAAPLMVRDSTHAADAELVQRVEAWRVAYNNGDLQTLASFYSEDSRYVSPHVPDLMLSGRDAITKNFGMGIKGGGHIDAITILAAEGSCDLAVLVCRYDATNSGVKVSGKNILVMRRVDGRWLITTHASIVRD